MAYDELNLELWDFLPEEEQIRLAHLVARDLPAPFRFLAVQTFALGEYRHNVALFDYRGAHFALIPGGSVTLGHDPSEPFLPTPAQLSAWEEVAERNGINVDIEAYVAGQSTPPRVAELEPFLMEVRATEAACVEAIPLDHPIFNDIPSMPEYDLVIYQEGVEYHREIDDQKQLRAYRLQRVTRAQLNAHLADEGFRLPTSDEWEHACRAGSRTLFRWGNACPVDCFPGDAIGWTLHREPNAFGLYIADNPYHWELVAEPCVARGGESRGRLCKDAAYLVEWFTLASAYIDKIEDCDPCVPLFGAYMRRLFPLR